MAWTRPPVETDPDAATRRILTELRARIPGHETHEGDPVTILAEEVGRETALLGVAFTAALEEAIAGIGQTVFGVPAIEAAAAILTARLTVTAAGVIPPGFTVLGTTAAGEEVAFTTPVEVAAAPPYVDVPLTAVVPAAAANAVEPGALVVVTATAIVSDATALATPIGGADAETRVEYLSRLTAYLGTLRPGGVRGADLAVLARSVPGVHRALGLDLYDPAAPGVMSERTATIVPVDEDGNAVSGPLGDAVKAKLEDARELNFVVHVAPPTYTGVEVEFEAVSLPGATPAVVRTAVIDAITSFLSPATWGSTTEDRQEWIDTPVVRYLDLARVAGSVPGVAYLTSLTIDGVAADKPLSGAGCLPASMDDPVTPSTVDGTVA